MRRDIHVQAAVQLLGGLISTRAVSGDPMPAPEELDQLVDFVLHGVSSR